MPWGWRRESAGWLSRSRRLAESQIRRDFRDRERRGARHCRLMGSPQLIRLLRENAPWEEYANGWYRISSWRATARARSGSTCLYARKFAQHFRRSPEILGEREIRRYLLHLLDERQLCHASYRQAYSALKFLYTVTLKRAVRAAVFSAQARSASVARRAQRQRGTSAVRELPRREIPHGGDDALRCGAACVGGLSSSPPATSTLAGC